MVDTYDGWGAHGGGAFSSEDFRQVCTSMIIQVLFRCRSIDKYLVG